MARACSCAGTCWGCSCRDCQQIFCGDSQGYSCSVKKQMGMGENHCQPWHKLGTQGITSCNTPKLGSWSEQRPHVSHPCSTGSSQRKGAKSVPTQVTPGCKDTCRTRSRTEQSQIGSTAAVMSLVILSPCDRAGLWDGRSCTIPHCLHAAPRDCGKGTMRHPMLGCCCLHSACTDQSETSSVSLTLLPVAQKGPWDCASIVLLLF